jgi:Baseplate J-like protein
MQGNNLEQEINRILANLENEEEKAEPERDGAHTGYSQEEIIEETIEVYFIPGASKEDAARIIDSELAGPGVENDPAIYFTGDADTEIPQTSQDDEAERQLQRKSTRAGIATALFGLFLIFSSLAFQINLILHPPIVTVTLVPKSQEVTLITTLQFGRLLAPITLSQTATAPTTGKGHQDARSATGILTFYNGQLSVQTVPARTILTGTDGVQIVTDQDATIPALDPTANPPTVGQITVSAHAINPGMSGNIPAYDISQPCCLASVIAKNTAAFHGGANERNFQTVTKSDIDVTAGQLKDTLNLSAQGALQGELKAGEALASQTCSPAVSSNHQAGDEATSVKVTSTLTCSGIAYNAQVLDTKATELLISTAFKQLGPGYSLFGTIRVTVNHAIPTHNTPTLVFSIQGLWVFAISNKEQERIKRLIKGHTKQEALHILASLPGIEKASMNWDDNTKLPRDSRYIHLVLIAGI